MPSLLPLPIDDLPGFLDMLRQHNLVLRRQHTCLQQQSRGKFILHILLRVPRRERETLC